MNKRTRTNRRKQTKKYRKQRKTRKQSCGCLKLDWNWNKIKGGEYGEIPNYALNTWNSDPNYAQISARNMPTVGGKTNKKGGFNKKGGSLLASFSAIDGQEAANTVLANPPQVDGSPNVQPLIKSFYAV